MHLRNFLFVVAVALGTMLSPAAAEPIDVTDRNLTPEQLAELLAPSPDMGSSQPGPAPRTGLRMRIKFAVNSSRVPDDATDLLRRIAQALNHPASAQFRYELVGHTDKSGQLNRNMSLSQRRAESVLRYLVDTEKVDASRLQARGEGPRRLLPDLADNAPEHRRVELLLKRD